MAPDLPASVSDLRDLLLDDATLGRAVASGRQRNATAEFRRVEARYVDGGTGRRLHITSYDDSQAHTRNVDPGPDAERAVDELLAQPFAHWHVETAAELVQLRVTKRGKVLLHRTRKAEPNEPDRSHDRSKRRKLAESDELFQVLGMATADGQIKPTRRAKFRQVQDFLAALDPLLDCLVPQTDAIEAAPMPDSRGADADRALRLVDLGCGNAYLTFAAFRYLTEVKRLTVHAVGVDVKRSAREHNEQVAHRLGAGASFLFVDSTISAASVPEQPDLVVALHACDTATDEALARAVSWHAPVVLAAPCCHHDVQRQLDAGAVPEAYRLITRHGILRERFADVLTDALRAAVLRLVGYRVDVVEFVDSEHTPRNVLIRAVRTDAPPPQATVDAYRQLCSEWGVQPALAAMLGADHPVLRPAT